MSLMLVLVDKGATAVADDAFRLFWCFGYGHYNIYNTIVFLFWYFIRISLVGLALQHRSSDGSRM
jgi:hypothetical protein